MCGRIERWHYGSFVLLTKGIVVPTVAPKLIKTNFNSKSNPNLCDKVKTSLIGFTILLFMREYAASHRSFPKTKEVIILGRNANYRCAEGLKEAAPPSESKPKRRVEQKVIVYPSNKNDQ